MPLKGRIKIKKPRLFERGNGIAAFSRRLNLLLFVVIIAVMAVIMTMEVNFIAAEISLEDARGYAVSVAETLSARVGKEIGLIAKAARSSAVAGWMEEEGSGEGKAAAYEELLEIIGGLYSYNLYATVGRSLNEYKIGVDGGADGAAPFDTLKREASVDSWYFECLQSAGEYMLSVDIDHVLRRKRIWLDYKVIREGEVLGAVSTGMEFSHLVGELFAHNSNMRGLVIDERGMAYIDSALMQEEDFLYDDFEKPIGEVFSDPSLLAVVESYLAGEEDAARSIELSGGSYRHITIVPVELAGWSVILLSGDVSALKASFSAPLIITLVALLIVFVLASGIINYRVIFRPLRELDRSLAAMRENSAAPLYGIERGDELGRLSRTIQDLFRQANIDALTGIYNRRFMETGLAHMEGLLVRSGSLLSVIMVDIDLFKKYNDTYGHGQGDVCLKKVAQSMEAAIRRAGDFTARYGGEEFVVVLPNTDENGARQVAESLLENVRAMGIPHAQNSAAPYVTISAGVTTVKVMRGGKWEDYVKRADEALYLSKQNGRNRYTHLPFSDSSGREESRKG